MPIMLRVSLLLAAFTLVVACTTPSLVAMGPALSRVRANPTAYTGQKVHWGGRIARVDNQPHDTLIEVVQQPLSSDGRPESTPTSEGRFIARFDGFLDPAIFAPGKRLTVSGTVHGTRKGRIGDYQYQFPVVNVVDYRLWPKYRPPRIIYYRDPWWPGPYFGPYPWPYRYPWP